MEVEHEIDQATLQSCPLPHQRDETALRDADGAFGIEQL